MVSLCRYRQASANDDRASECSSTASSKPPMYPLTPTGQMRHGYTTIGLKQRDLRTKLHKTRYAQSLRQTNISPTMYDSPSSRRTPTSSPHRPQIAMPITSNKTNELNNERRNIDDDDENDSLFSELRMSSIPSSNFSQNDARLPPPVPSNTTNKITESKLNVTKNSTLQTAPTTLSIEERRVQESLERLDRQLKEVQTKVRSNSNTRIQKNQKR
ncbi:unnamed protein product [Rotaria sp. Silwood1]|nr:unnamed protein product [Rotaria sp. Silwood1]CAF1321935.1 unnamed protein product [Rotaria sp. Silwood1]CAF3557717.1 unnamed protein product [Rotaria sp. Silwood1]CAF4565404.1 unnamed protein product [Rotaria sp. Silwood1]